MHADEARARAQRLVAALQWAPPLGIRAAEMLKDLEPAQNGRAAAAVLQRDPALAARVLKIANAPLYGASGRIDSLERAVIMLGTSALAGIALMASLDATLETTKGLEPALVARVRTRSMEAAAHARALALRFATPCADAALSAAVLHELGVLVMLRIDADLARRLLTSEPEPGLVDANCAREREAFGTDHALLGGALLRRWHLPERIAAAVEGHHSPDAARDPLSAVVHLATDAASVVAPAPATFTPDERLLATLGATAADVERVVFASSATDRTALVA